MDCPSNSLPSTDSTCNKNENENAFEGIAPPSLSPECLQSSSSDYPSYDVFLNHRGPDVKKTLTRLIYSHLSAFDLRVFLDQNELRTGDFLPAAIQHALATSKVHVAIFSPRYAESPWCLAELSFMLRSGAKIIPVFYDVEPFHARYIQSGPYAQAFQTYQEKKRIDLNIVEKWKEDLYRVSFISGMVFNTSKDDEGMLLKSIVDRVVEEGKGEVLDLGKHPVGLDEALEAFQHTIMESDGYVKVVGIVGMGGSGKTTLAKRIYNYRSWAYKGCCCFLSDVRSEGAKNGMASLQSKLLQKLLHYEWKIDNTSQGKELMRNRLLNLKVLIVLDDIDNGDQIDALLVKEVLGEGSLVIVTSRDKGVLTSSGISLFQEVKGLGENHARELFCRHAFLLPYPSRGFETLVHNFLVACSGLPLSLKVMGALLYGKGSAYWKGTLEKIGKHILPSSIINTLKISYDALDREEKEIFLDIAWFFAGEDKNMVVKIWDGCGWSSLQSIESLEQKCLIEFAQNGENRVSIRMHDHLRDMGRDMIDKQTPPTRLWRPEDIRNYVSRHQLGMVMEVRGICVIRSPSVYAPTIRRLSAWKECWMQVVEIISRILRVSHVEGEGRGSALKLLAAEGDSVVTQFSDVSGDLLWLRWYDSPYSKIPSTLSIHNLRVLELFGGCSDLHTLWQGHHQAPMMLRELYVWGTYGCCLLKLPKSIGFLKHLEKIVLKAGKMRTLPDEMCQLEWLNYLDLSHCSDLQSLPTRFGDLRNLRHLDLTCCQLQALPDSFTQLIQLQYLCLFGCKELMLSPGIFANILTLEYLELHSDRQEMLPIHITCQGFLRNLYINCFQLKVLPTDMGELHNLEVLEISSMELIALPSSMGNLGCLKSLNLLNCKKLNCVPESFARLKNLKHLSLYETGIRLLPESLAHLSNLVELIVQYSPLDEIMLSNLGDAGQAENTLGPRNPLLDSAMFLLKSINLSNTKITELCITKDVCPNLETLEVPDCKSLIQVEAFATTLVKLDLCKCHRLKKISGLSNLTKLRSLNISGCAELEELEKLSDLRSLELLLADGCYMLTKIEGLQHLHRLKDIRIAACHCDIWKGIICLKELPSKVSSISLNMEIVGWNEREMDSILRSFSFPVPLLQFSTEWLCRLELAEVKSCSAVITVVLCKSSIDDTYDPHQHLLKLGSNYSMQEYVINMKVESECECMIISMFTEESLYVQELKSIKNEDNIGMYVNIPNRFGSRNGWAVALSQGEEWKISQIWEKLFTYAYSKRPFYDPDSGRD